MLHIFLSNRPGEVRYGTTGSAGTRRPAAVVDDDGEPSPGRAGRAPHLRPDSRRDTGTIATRPERRSSGPGPAAATRTRNGEGYYVYSGRSDDMLKVGGMYVSPIEVEAALTTHPAVLEAAVIGREDEERLVKPMAYVVLKPGRQASGELLEELKQHATVAPGALQVSALGGVHRGAAEDRDRKDRSASSCAEGVRRVSPALSHARRRGPSQLSSATPDRAAFSTRGWSRITGEPSVMSLTPGARLGPYEIRAPLGSRDSSTRSRSPRMAGLMPIRIRAASSTCT